MTDDTLKRIAPEEWERWNAANDPSQADGLAPSFNAGWDGCKYVADALIAKLAAAVEELTFWQQCARFQMSDAALREVERRVAIKRDREEGE